MKFSLELNIGANGVVTLDELCAILRLVGSQVRRCYGSLHDIAHPNTIEVLFGGEKIGNWSIK